MPKCFILFTEDDLSLLIITNRLNSLYIERATILLIWTEFLFKKMSRLVLSAVWKLDANILTSIQPFKEDIISLRRKLRDYNTNLQLLPGQLHSPVYVLIMRTIFIPSKITTTDLLRFDLMTRL